MNELTDERLAELRTIAEAATPGPWEWDGLGDFYGTPRMQGWLAAPPWAQEEQTVLRSVAMHADCDIEASNEDAQHIAAFDPPTVLALLSDVERLRAQLTITVDLPGLVADMLNAWYVPSNPLAGTPESYRELKHRPYGQRDFDGMVAILSAALGGEQR